MEKELEETETVTLRLRAARRSALREALDTIEGARKGFDDAVDRHPDWTAGYNCARFDCAAAILRLLEASK